MKKSMGSVEMVEGKRRYRSWSWVMPKSHGGRRVSAIHDVFGFTLHAYAGPPLQPGGKFEVQVLRGDDGAEEARLSCRVIRRVERREVLAALRICDPRLTAIVEVPWYEVIAD